MAMFRSNPELYFTAGGGACAFFMALLRSGGFTKLHLAERFTDATMCSMLSSAITLVCIEYWNLDCIYAVPIGTFVGFVGTDFVSSIIKSFINSKLKVVENNDDDKDK